MNLLLKKLQHKDDIPIFILNHPEEFNPQFEDFSNYTKVDSNIDSLQISVLFALVFVKSHNDILLNIKDIWSHVRPETNLWFAYPKKSSKKYKTDISRDSGWQILGELGFEPVRQIAIDDDWSALRFRHIGEIKKFTRNKSMAISEEGKKRKS